MIRLEHKILPDIQTEQESSLLIKKIKIQIKAVGDSGQEIWKLILATIVTNIL